MKMSFKLVDKDFLLSYLLLIQYLNNLKDNHLIFLFKKGF